MINTEQVSDRGLAVFEGCKDLTTLSLKCTPVTDAGVPGFGLVTDPLHYFDYHHSPADTLDKIDPHELAQNTAALAALTWSLAEQGLQSR